MEHQDGGSEGRGGGQAAGGAFEDATRALMPDAVVTRLLLLRHGETRGFRERRVRGQDDVPLAPRGERQGAALARWLAAGAAGGRCDALLTSDLARCRLLAEACGAALCLSPEPEPRLREQHMGRWQGRTWEEISRDEAARVSAYWDDYVDAAPPGGESMRALHARVGGWLDEVLARRAGQRLLVVTHVGPIRALLCRALGVPAEESLRFAPAAGSATALAIGAAGIVVETLGERPWLALEEPAP